MPSTEIKQIRQNLQSSNGIVPGERIQVPNIVCQFEAKRNPSDLYKECLEWYKKSKSSPYESTKRFASFYELSCFCLPNFSKEMMFWTINLTNCVFDLDDYISFILPDPNFTKYHQLSRVIFRCNSVPIEPDSICPGYNVHNAEAIQEVLRNIKELANGSPYGDFLVRDWEEWFQNQYYDRIVKPKFGSVEDYLNYRYVNVGGPPYATLIVIGLGYNFPMEIFLHKYVVGIKERMYGNMAIVNDLFSYNREIKTEADACNILKYSSIEQATSLLKLFEDEMLQLIEKIKKEDWVVGGKDYKAQVVDYCENIKYICSGHVNGAQLVPRYLSHNEVNEAPLHGIMDSNLLRLLQAQVRKLTWRGDEKILEHGCRTGHMASIYLFPKLEETNSKLYGVDISKPMIEHAKLNFANKNVEYFATALDDPGFALKNECFDKIFSIGALQFDNMYKETIGKMLELLVAGGQLILVLVTKSCAFDALQYVKSLPDWVQHADSLQVPDWVSEGDVDVGQQFEKLLDQIGFRTLEVLTNESYNSCSEKEWANWVVTASRGQYEVNLSEDLSQKDLIQTIHSFMLSRKENEGKEGRTWCEILLVHAEKPAK